MPNQNLAQVYAANPITTIGATDLMYVVTTGTTDAAIQGSSFIAQFSPLTTKGDLYTFSTVNARLGVGTVNGQILQVNAAAATGLSWSTTTYPATTTINQLLYSSSANVVQGITTANLGVLATNASGVPSINTQLLPFIVGPGGFYTTIQSAINAAALTATAATPKTVLINSGTYIENLTLQSFVSLASFSGVSENAVIIEGNTIYNPINDNELLSCSGITFITPVGGSPAFSIQGTKICIVDMNDCVLNGTTGTAIECINVNASLTKSNCHLFASAGQKICNYTAGNIVATSGFATATDTASTVSGTANVTITNYFSANAYVLTGTSQLSAVNSTFLPPNNLSFIDIGATSIGIIFSSIVISMSPSGFWAIGTGAIAINSITTINGSAGAVNSGTLTILQEPLTVGNLSFDGGNSNITTNGELIIGDSSGQPKISTLTAGAGIGITNGAGSITISSTGSVTWNNVVTNTRALLVNEGYITDNGASLVTYTLPVTAAQGSIIEIAGFSSGLFKIAQNTGQKINIGNQATTITTGSLTATNANDFIKLLCVVADTTFNVIDVIGNFTVA